MKAAVLYEYGKPLVVEEVELDGPKQGEVMVKIGASGVCHSDYVLLLQDANPTPSFGGFGISGPLLLGGSQAGGNTTGLPVGGASRS